MLDARLAAGRFGCDMPLYGDDIESLSTDQRSHSFRSPVLQYAEIIAAALGVLVLAVLADLATGKRGLFATLLVSAVGAVCGWFLAVRVFGVSTLSDWTWVGWALAGSVLCLVAFFLFRSKR